MKLGSATPLCFQITSVLLFLQKRIWHSLAHQNPMALYFRYKVGPRADRCKWIVLGLSPYKMAENQWPYWGWFTVYPHKWKYITLTSDLVTLGPTLQVKKKTVVTRTTRLDRKITNWNLQSHPIEKKNHLCQPSIFLFLG